jgi:TonB-linked SusC/RagA family outer membrane protein
MSYQSTHLRAPVIGLLVLLLLPCVLLAQVKISGTVTDKKNTTSIPGVVVREKGTSQGTTTNEKGQYSLELRSANPVIIVSFVGYQSQEIKVGNKTDIDISLIEDVKGLNDVVVIGYQDIQRRKTTSAVSSVKGKEIENTPYPTFDAMLQGRVAGLTVLTVSGEPGSNNIVNVRGSSSVTPGGISAPLYVIDGIVFNMSDYQDTYGNNNPLSAINPNDIESIDILKDASASAIYGARAANGVIIVRTKRPKMGSTDFRVSMYGGIGGKPAMKPIITGAAERRYKMDILQDLGSYIGNGNLSQFLTDSLNTAFNNNTDWQGLFLQNAMISNVDANVSGADEKYSYRIALNRYTEEGVMIGYGIQRITPRLFLSVKPNKNVEVSTDLFMGFVKTQHGAGDLGFSRYPFTAWGFPSSFWKITDEEKDIYTGRYDALRDDDRTTSINGNTRVVIKLLPGLQLTSTLAYNFNTNRRDYFIPAVINGGRNDAISRVFGDRRMEQENYLLYTKKVKDHSFTGILGQGAEHLVRNQIYARGNGITVDAIKTIQGVPPGAGLTAWSAFDERTRLSFWGRLGYSYKERYMLQVDYRRDASSIYSKNNRWGQFPAISGGWIVSDESFLEPLKNTISFLKFRGSYGITGSDPGNFYAKYLRLITDASYRGSTLDGINWGSDAMTTYNGTSVVFPDYYNAAAAANISWERSPQYNLGIDVNFIKDRISLTADYYVRNSKSKVFDVALPVTTGYNTVSDNFVDLRNTGIELTLNTNNLSARSPLQWRTNFNISFNKNYVTRLPGGGRDFKFGDPWLQRSLSIGQPLFTFQVWEVNGVYATDADVPVDPKTGKRMTWVGGNEFRAGDPARKDQNGDYNIDDQDKISMGDPNPKVIGGMTNSFVWKGISLDILCTFITGRKLWNGYLSDKLQDAGTADPYSLWGPRSGPASDFGAGVDFWRKPGDHASYPSLVTNNVDKWHIAQSLFVEDASFFRIKNVRLGYSLPQKWTSRLKLKSVRVYGILDNVWVFSRATVPDPEAVQVDGYSSGNDYPIPKKATLGLEVNF